MWFDLVLVVILIGLNGMLAGAEMAYVTLRPSQLPTLERAGTTGRLASRLANDLPRLLSTVQVGITLAGLFASATAAVSIGEELAGPLEGLGGAAEPVSIAIVTLVLAYVTLVFGELVPKALARQRPMWWAPLLARPLSGLAVVFRPAVWLLAASTSAVVRLVGGDPAKAGDDITEEELREIVESTETMTAQQREIISGALELGTRRLYNILIPRRDVLALAVDISAEVALDSLVRGGHSKAPVYGRNVDDIVGVVHLRDVVDATGEVRDHLRPATALPESLGVLDALRALQAARSSLAIVVDEHGGFAGIVTVEDLLEEIVGEIYDEFDDDLRAPQVDESGSVLLPGGFPAHDLAEIGVNLEPGDHATLAGVLLTAFGRVPEAGDTIDIDGWHIRVESVAGRTVGQALLKRGSDPP
jgi:putative hemolysin